MSSRPIVFISAVSSELESTRYLVANTLTSLGYQPKWEDIAPTETQDPKDVLRKWVDLSHAVVQIVGHRHGFAPAEPDEEFGSVSYTQFEALYAHKKGKPIWYIILDESHPVDCENDESAELKKLQSDYRIQAEAHHDLCHTSSTLHSTKDIVLNLRDALSTKPRPTRKRPAPLFALFLFTISGIIWINQRQGKADETVVPNHIATEKTVETLDPYLTATEKPDETVAATDPPTEQTSEKTDPVPSPLSQMEKVLVSLSDAENRSRIPGENLTLKELRNRACTLLEIEHSLTPGTLAASLPGIAFDIYANPDADLIVKASAAYALNKFEEAEKLFLEEEAKDKAAMESSGKDPTDLSTKRIQALEGAAQFATAQIQYARAVGHYRAAAALTSVARDPLEWARIHHMLAYALTYNGQYSDVEETLRQVIPVYEKHLGAEHPDTLGSINNLANALNSQGKHAEAEDRHRAVLAIRQRVLGPEHPDTLTSRNNLAATLNAQDKHEQAEEQHRAVLTIREHLLGADHLDTVFNRNNLAITLETLDKFAEAEQQYRAVLAIRQRILGAEHHDTLSSYDNIAKVLRSQKKYAEAEEQSRAVLAIRERLLGIEHHDVFLSCHHLAISLANQKKDTEALIFAQRALFGFTKNFGADHPYTKAAQNLVTLLESR